MNDKPNRILWHGPGWYGPREYRDCVCWFKMDGWDEYANLDDLGRQAYVQGLGNPEWFSSRPDENNYEIK